MFINCRIYVPITHITVNIMVITINFKFCKHSIGDLEVEDNKF